MTIEDNSSENILDENNSEVPTDPEELESYISNAVKLRWSRVIIVAFVIGLVLIAVNLIIIWVVNMYYPIFYLGLPWYFFIEMGILFIWGSCLGTMKQSFTIDRIKNRLIKGEPITGADTKIAIGSAYTYILAGVILGIASFISWLIVR